ncbi:hypothetical protein [Candidatus Nitrosacidococcus sp. I8]|uniref:COG4315 family predicted lipoprotein n=1 Tax=Candidatus Nitrosacidococcus sp. I8 TaxID=2942908 RepID=UPI002226142A|nr:hypothetical protein [Candidatus Nitrosacidococcus sp. I8]CAH9016757.1 hypothetical protein NURINAE_00243 [Candidatus Nitrosacidococcus sp. I8]
MKSHDLLKYQTITAFTLLLIWGVTAQALSTAEKSPYGVYLIDMNGGNSLYISQADKQGKTSNCYGECSKTWMPVTTESKAGDEVDNSLLSSIKYTKDGMWVVYGTDTSPKNGKINPSLLGTIQRKDGLTQVTYNGWPLYYHAQDLGPYDTYGQNKESFGARWHLMNPSGKAVGSPVTASIHQ